MLFGMLAIYLLCTIFVWIVGAFADDDLHICATTPTERALGAILWPVFLPLVLAATMWVRLHQKHVTWNSAHGLHFGRGLFSPASRSAAKEGAPRLPPA